jgi:AcrR family transcriptional regulator
MVSSARGPADPTGKAESVRRRGHETPKRTGRRPGKSGSREEILRAARQLFADRGYAGTTIRAIALEAKVDSALIHHFFGSKQFMFAAAIADIFQPEELMAGLLEQGTDGLGERVVRTFLTLWEAPESRTPLLAVLRSAISNEEAADALRSFVTSELLRLVANAIAVPDPELRAGLVGAQLIGLAMLRLVLEVEPLATTDAEVLVRSLGPTVQFYLTAPNLLGGGRLEVGDRGRRRSARS